MRIEDDIKLDYSDVLIRPKRSTLTSRYDVLMTRKYTFYHSKKTWTGVPIMASNMDTVGTPQMYERMLEHEMITCPARHYLKKDATMWRIGTTDNKMLGKNVCMMGGVDHLITHHLKWEFIGIDVANGYTISVVDSIRDMRERLPDSTIVVGNVVTADMTQELILAGADIVKVGVGPGSVCTTRTKTGIGYPQLSAVMECADAAHGLGAHIIADGGCNTSGDIVKAFAAGADFVMIGGMLAGHDECDGVIENGKMKFYGMASKSAMSRHNVPHREYRGVEGKTVYVDHKGPVNDTLVDILSGIRSACTYVGAEKLKTLSKCATFIRVNNTHNTIFGDE
jgi:GMP reductase